MTTSASSDTRLDEIIGLLSRLKGVKHVFYLTDNMRRGLERIEKHYPSLGPLAIRNDGVLECLRREHVACLIKDRHFRPPPSPTVVLIDDSGKVIGRELLPGERPPSPRSGKTIMLGNDFVIFFEKGSGRGAKFVLPPVGFRELDSVHGVKRVCSSSPSAMGDMHLRRMAGLEDDPKLASVLVGFDLSRPWATACSGLDHRFSNRRYESGIVSDRIPRRSKTLSKRPSRNGVAFSGKPKLNDNL